MSGKGEVYRRADRLWAFRVRAANNAIVATDAAQGYANKRDAIDVLRRLMGGGFDGPISEVE